MSLFTEFGNEGNIARIIGMEVLTHWYLLVLLIVMIWSMWKLFPQSWTPSGATTPALLPR